MSIILRALKKVQEQDAEQETGSISPEATSIGGAASDVPAVTSSRAGQMSVGADSVTHGASAAGDRLSSSQVFRHSFGLAPKALLVLLVVLGMCTTGWFASKIYLNLKLASEASASRTSSGSAGGEPEEHTQIAEAASADDGAATVLENGAPALSEAATRARSPEEGDSRLAKAEPHPARAAVGAIADRPTQPTAEPNATSEVIYYAAESPAPIKPNPPAVIVKEAMPEKKGRPELKINAIAWKNEEPRAIVNMQSVYEGDLIEGAKVLAIKRKIIVFEYEGETFEVRF